MARYTGAVCRLCRREKIKLYLKGAKCDTMKCPVERRPYPPGQHGRGRVRETEYLAQLREKQKARRIYGVLEKQFRITFREAARRGGKTGDNLLQLLETRLDNVVYRSGFASSRNQARQLIRHGHVQVAGKRVDIPSYQLKKGDTIALTSRAKEMIQVRHSIEVVDHTPPMWIDVDKGKASITVSDLPLREQIDIPVREQLIVELYSK
jgi:small subunit ribosomal protein S4